MCSVLTSSTVHPSVIQVVNTWPSALCAKAMILQWLKLHALHSAMQHHTCSAQICNNRPPRVTLLTSSYCARVVALHGQQLVIQLSLSPPKLRAAALPSQSDCGCHGDVASPCIFSTSKT
eukprot:5900808-Amphidinium_carterae.1